MYRFRLQPSALHVAFLCGSFVGVANALHEGWGFDRDKCYNRTIQWLADGNNSASTEWFHRDPLTSALLDRLDNVELTLSGCKHFCGGWTFYWDAGPRVTTWVIPILLLLSNIELSPIDKRRFMTIIHALGDPIDSLWSLTHKIYTWHRLYEIGLSKCPRDPNGRRDKHRARIIATVLAGFEEISGARINNEGYYDMICEKLGRLGKSNEDDAMFNEWHKAARQLADGRTNEFLRTVLAIIVYVFGLISAFSPDVGGGNTTPPGGRIGSAIFLSWLVPVALLSNTIGTFASRRTCLDIMSHFMVAVNPRLNRDSNNGDDQAVIAKTAVGGATQARTDGNSNIRVGLAAGSKAELTVASDIEASCAAPSTNVGNDNPPKPLELNLNHSRTYNENMANADHLFNPESWDHYFDSMQWLGSIYTYRPWKTLYLDGGNRTNARLKNSMMFLWALLPVFVSALGAFVILWYAVPNGFSCRHVWVVGVFFCYLLSVAYTWVWYSPRQERAHWRAVLIKDGLVALASIPMVFLSTAGLFNNCYCWSVAMALGAAASVPLVTDQAYEDNSHHIYQFVVMSCMLFHLLFFVAILTQWYHGVKLVRWSEKKRRDEWKYSMGSKLEYTRENFLIFWSIKEEKAEA